MKKAKIVVEETHMYQREIELLVPDEMEESVLDQLLTMAERKKGLYAFVCFLRANGVQTPSGYEDDLSSPLVSTIECLDLDIE